MVANFVFFRFSYCAAYFPALPIHFYLIIIIAVMLVFSAVRLLFCYTVTAVFLCLHRVFSLSVTIALSPHLTKCKFMVIVWRLRGNIFRTVSYCQLATSLMATVTESSHSQVGP